MKEQNGLKAALRKSVFPLLAIASLVAAPAMGDDAGDVGAEVLVKYCGMTGEDPDSHTAIAFCYGYIDAALDYHHAILPSGERITCPPGTVTRQDVALAVVEWAKVNTDKIDDQPPVNVVIQAASDQWPCEEK